jgi:hypothetical protein
MFRQLLILLLLALLGCSHGFAALRPAALRYSVSVVKLRARDQTALHALDPALVEILNRALDKADAFGTTALDKADAFGTGASAFATGASAFATGASAFAVVALALLAFSVYQTTVGMRFMRAEAKADRDEDRAAMQTMRNETNQKFATTTVFTVISILISTAPYFSKPVGTVTANLLAFLQSGLT